MPLEVARQWPLMAGKFALGNYHLLLAHDVARDPEGYREVYGDIVEDHIDGVVIMDNSVIELGRPASDEEMRVAVNAVHANVVVLPDELLDMERTLEATHRALREWTFLKGHEFEVDRMIVPQGKDFNEWVTCLERMSKLFRHEFGWVGIPKNVNLIHKVSRREAIEVVEAICPGAPIHLLGFSRNIRDDILSARYSHSVKGIDSAVPIRMGMRDYQTVSMGTYHHGERGNWWDEPYSTLAGANPTNCILKGIQNTEIVRGWLNA